MSQNVTFLQIFAAEHLVRGYKITEVAKMVDVSRETITRWKRDPEFQKIMQEYAEEMRADTHTRFASLLDSALTCLDRHLSSSGGGPVALRLLQLLAKTPFLVGPLPISSPEEEAKEKPGASP